MSVSKYIVHPSKITGGVTGVKCIAANNEYLSSPAGDYFGGSFDGLYARLDFESDEVIMLFNQGDVGNDYFSLIIGNDDIILVTKTGSFIVFHSYPITRVLGSQKIELIGSGINIEVKYNDVSSGSNSFTHGFPNIIADELFFAKNQDTTKYNAVYNYIKINSHEWLASNWTAPTTTNSQGVITTLHSDVSTSAMIQSSEVVTPINSPAPYDVSYSAITAYSASYTSLQSYTVTAEIA